MNFYDFLKQKYDNYKIGEGCKYCPCKILRNKMFGGMRMGICLEEIIYLTKKYNVCNDTNIYLCEDCMLAAVEIAKKLFGKEVNKI